MTKAAQLARSWERTLAEIKSLTEYCGTSKAGNRMNRTEVSV